MKEGAPFSWRMPGKAALGGNLLLCLLLFLGRGADHSPPPLYRCLSLSRIGLSFCHCKGIGLKITGEQEDEMKMCRVT